MPGVHAVLTPRTCRAEDLRARVRRPAGARDRPRPLLRRAGRAGRGRGARASASRGRRRAGRVRSARAGRRHGAATEQPPLIPSGRRWRTATARTTRNVVRHRDRHGGDPDARRRHGQRRLRPGIQDQAFLGPESGSRCRWRGRRRRLRRDAVAPRRPRPGRTVPRSAAGHGADHLAGVGGAFGGPRGPLDADPRRHARPAHEAPGEDRLQPRGVVLRPRAPPSGSDLVRAPSDAGGELVNVRMRILLDGGAYASSSTAVTSNAACFALGPTRSRTR